MVMNEMHVGDLSEYELGNETIEMSSVTIDDDDYDWQGMVGMNGWIIVL